MSDSRFGTCGAGAAQFAGQFGLNYLTYDHNPAVSLAPEFDPPEGVIRVVKVGLINDRPDGLGENIQAMRGKLKTWAIRLGWYHGLGWFSRLFSSKPKYTAWLHPNWEAIWAEEGEAILAYVARMRDKGTHAVLAFGNESNALLASITPEEYAAGWCLYAEKIRGVDPYATFLLGEPFSTDLVPEDSRDVVTKVLTSRLSTEGDKVIDAELTAMGLGFLADVSDGLTDPILKKVIADILALVKGRVFNLSTVEYMRRVVAAIPWHLMPRGISIHLYPWDYTGSQGLDAMMERMHAMTRAILTHARDHFDGTIPLWITEFGNAVPAPTAGPMTEGRAFELLARMVDEFQENYGWDCYWFYFKPWGMDDQVKEFVTIFQALAAQGTFDLTAFGQFYLARARGEEPKS